MRAYTGIERNTKDFDLMMRPLDVPQAINAFQEAGFPAGYAFSHWLAKAHHGEYFLDIVFRAGNGLCEVDDGWFANARQRMVFGQMLPICPPEELIWQKSYIMERERFDGADVQHLLRSCAKHLDWERLLKRFGPDWRILLSHLVLFGFVYPGERMSIPKTIFRRLLRKAAAESAAQEDVNSLCQGTLLSRAQYLADVERWGYSDARSDPRVQITRAELRDWTNAIDESTRSQ